MKVFLTKGFIKSFNKLYSNNPYYVFLRTIKDWKYRIKWAYQRAVRGYDDPWTWDIHSNLSDIMIKILPILRKNCHGCCPNLFDNKRTDDECWKWQEILLKIEEGFKAAKRIDCMDNWDDENSSGEAKKKDEEDLKIFHEGMALFKEYYFNLWD